MAIDSVSTRSQRSRGQRKTRHSCPAVWMRAGTSKGLFLHERHLPAQREQWGPIILAAMGSQDSDPKQLNGVAGATSTTSKVAIVRPSSRADVDVEYTFVQVAIGSPRLDFTGNCGNIASGVGPFAVDEGIVHVEPGQQTAQVRILNTNTDRLIIETFEVDENGRFLEDGEYQLAGTRSYGSPVRVSFEKPAGAMTGTLLPTGNATDTLTVPGTATRSFCEVKVSMVDAANPFVLVDAESLPEEIRIADPASNSFLEFIEAVRCRGAVGMGLARSIEQAAQTRGTPKIAILSLSESPQGGVQEMPDVQVTALSMGKVHGSLQLTGAVCLICAICTVGTVSNRIAKQVEQRRMANRGSVLPRTDSFMGLAQKSREVLIKHPGGTISGTASLGCEGVHSVQLLRTARRLFEGNVCYLA